MKPQPQRYGLLERIEGRWIRGWAFDPDRPDERMRIIVLLDGDISGFAIANEFREDLRDSGLGDGAHAFRCELPPDKLHSTQIITIITERDGSFMLVHEQRMPGSVPIGIDIERRTKPSLYFDISDLLEFLSNYRDVSGIQRVQCGYLSNALVTVSTAFDIRVCAQIAGACRYVEIANDRAIDIMEAINGKRLISLSDWRDYIATERLGTGCVPAFRPELTKWPPGTHKQT